MTTALQPIDVVAQPARPWELPFTVVWCIASPSRLTVQGAKADLHWQHLRVGKTNFIKQWHLQCNSDLFSVLIESQKLMNHGA